MNNMTKFEEMRRIIESTRLQMDKLMCTVGLLRDVARLSGFELNIPKEIPDNTFAICTPGKAGLRLLVNDKWVNLQELKRDTEMADDQENPTPRRMCIVEHEDGFWLHLQYDSLRGSINLSLATHLPTVLELLKKLALGPLKLVKI